MLVTELFLRHRDEKCGESTDKDDDPGDIEDGRIAGNVGFEDDKADEGLHRLRADRVENAVLRNTENVAVDIVIEDGAENSDAKRAGNVPYEREDGGRFTDIVLRNGDGDKVRCVVPCQSRGQTQGYRAG